MRLAILAAAILVACGRQSAEVTDYVTVATGAVGAMQALAERDRTAFQLVEVRGDEAIVRVEDRELEALAQDQHARLDRCGGFMAFDSLDEARAHRPERPPPTYTIDRDQVVRAVLPALDRERILATIAELSAMPTRHYQSASGAAASLWLRDRWRSFTDRTDVTVELFDHGYAQKSVILTIPGTTRPDEVVVIGGHLDSISMRGRDARAPGADDDASGIATLDEVARVLLAKQFRPARTIKFIAYAAEEVGLRGSLSIVREFRRRDIDVVGALQLDMTNYRGSERDIWLITDHTSAAPNAFLARLIDTYVGASWGYDQCGYACSDHASWNRAGVPASMPFESRADQRNRQIHTAADTLELSGNNADHAVQFARLATAYAIELAKGEVADGPPPAASRHPWWLAFGLLGGASALLWARRSR
jgi:leucyl aminopeptidase